MEGITVTMKDGEVKQFPYKESRDYGHTKMRYEIGFVVITDEWGTETSIPTDDISKIVNQPQLRGRW